MAENPVQQLELQRHGAGAFLQSEVERVVIEVLDNADVSQAQEAWKAAQAKIPELNRAHRNLNDQCTSFSKESAAAADQFRDALIEHATRGGDPNELNEMALRAERVRARARATFEALQFVVEHAMPRAEIFELQAHAEFLHVLSAKLKARADARLAETMASLAGVAETEAVVSFDPTRTVAGHLDALARDYSIKGTGLRTQAVNLDRKYTEFCSGQGKAV